MKLLSIISTSILILVSYFYFKPNQLSFYKTSKNAVIEKNISNSSISFKSNSIEKNKRLPSNTSKEIAYSEIVVNKDTGKEEIVTHLPKGKRLYNEHLMQEISQSATIDVNY